MVVKESAMESVTEYAFSFRLWEFVFSNVSELTSDSEKPVMESAFIF